MNTIKEYKIILNEIKKAPYTKNLIKIIWCRNKETKKVMSYDFYLVFDNTWDCVESTKNYDVMKKVIDTLKKDFNFKVMLDEDFF